VSKKLIYVGRVSVTPLKLPRQLVEFKARHMQSLKLHPAQTLRFMLLSGRYVLGPEMVNNGVHSILKSFFHSPVRLCGSVCVRFFMHVKRAKRLSTILSDLSHMGAY
jgi:hypothetical protein